MGFVGDGDTRLEPTYHEPRFPDDDPEVSPQPAPRQPLHPARLDRTDWLRASILTLSVGVACLVLADLIPSYLLHSMDFWFESDTVREVSNMTSVTDDHSRTSVHPLFSI